MQNLTKEQFERIRIAPLKDAIPGFYRRWDNPEVDGIANQVEVLLQMALLRINKLVETVEKNRLFDVVDGVDSVLNADDASRLWDIFHKEIHLGIEPDLEEKDFCRNILQYHPKAYADINEVVMSEFDGNGDIVG